MSAFLFLNIPKSIEKKRIITKGWIFEIIYSLTTIPILIMGVVFFVCIGPLVLFDISINKSTLIPMIRIMAFLTVLYILLLIYKILKISKFRVIKGINKKVNREAIREVSKKINLKKMRDNRQEYLAYLECKSILPSLNYSKEVIFLYDKNDILVNCSYQQDRALGANSPFCYFKNKKIEKQIEFEIKKILLKTNDTTKCQHRI